MDTFHNRTRRSKSISQRLINKKQFLLLPVYWLLLTSNLAKEAIENSGSYRLADHIYQGRPKGKYVIGQFLDWILLNLSSSKSFRSRYQFSKQEIISYLNQPHSSRKVFDILAVPSGLARELFEAAHYLHQINHKHKDRVRWHGLDLDRDLVRALKEKSISTPSKMFFYAGDALSSEAYRFKYDLVISLGLLDFLDDSLALKFLKTIKSNLKPNGRLVTSSMQPHSLSDYLLRNIAEIRTVYRSKHQLETIIKRAGFKKMRVYQNYHKLLTMVVATRV